MPTTPKPEPKTVDPPEPDPPEPDGDDPEPEPADAKALSAALAKERTATKREIAARKKLEQQLADLETASLSEQERAVAEAKVAGRQEAMNEVNGRLLRAEVRSRAAGKLIKPEHAAALLDLSTFDVDDAGEFDGDAIDAAIGALIDDNPHLAVPAANGASTTPRPPLGPRGVTSAMAATGGQPPAGSAPATTEGDAWLRSH